MSIVIAIILVTLTGLLCSVMLVVASHFMMVPKNEKEEKLRNCLPGANCGACGYSGCDSYAKALAEDSTIKTNLCVPGADKVAKELAEVLGVKALDVVEKVAFIHCFGDCTKRTKKNEYEGLKSCLAAKSLSVPRSASFDPNSGSSKIKAALQKLIVASSPKTSSNCSSCSLPIVFDAE